MDHRETNDVLRDAYNDSRPEALLCCTVENIRNLNRTEYSPACMIRNLPWKIMVKPSYRDARQSPNKKRLGFFVECNGESTSTSWSCNARIQMKILNQCSDGEAVVKEVQHSFCSKENDWGFHQFILWKDLLKPSRGFVKDNKIMLEVYVKADVPQGV